MTKYKWLYRESNFLNKVDQKKLKSFFLTTFDHELGWEPLPNTKKAERIHSQKKGVINFDQFARRYDSNESLTESDYVIFGDSYALSRQVNDSETIAHFLGEILNKNVPNYGVGNYGLDQSFLRYEKYKKNLKNKHILFIVVPETIVRISTRWRHLHETGNIFGFKPKFSINNKNKLILKKNPIKNFSDYEYIFKSFKENNSFLMEDPMYNYRFKNEAINIENFLKLKVSTYAKLGEYIEWRLNKNYLNNINDADGLSIRMKSNSKFSNYCYSKKNLVNLLEKLILKISKVTKNNMSIFILPQLSDLKLNCKNRNMFFKNFKKQYDINIFDATNFLLAEMGSKKNAESYYVEKGYGGHLNMKANHLMAKWIQDKIK